MMVAKRAFSVHHRAGRAATGLMIAALGTNVGLSQPPARVVFSEIHYHPSDSQGAGAEFIELLNTAAAAADLSGWRLTKGVDHTFPKGTLLAAGHRLVVAADADAFLKAFGADVVVGGVYSGRLDNGGELLRLKTALPADETVSEVDYDDLAPWPIAADGTGNSLELYDAAAAAGDAFDWRAGGPTPGADNSVSGGPPGIQLADGRHFPQSPGSGDGVTIGVLVYHVRPLRNVELKYQIGVRDGGPILAEPLNDAGAGGDAVAGDGFHSARLPANPSHTLVRYWFEAEDEDGQTARLPQQGAPTSSFGYYVDDGGVDTQAPLYFLVMEPALFNQLLSDTSDRLRPAALVHDGVVYDRIAIRQRGAFARSWPKKSFKLIFNRDHLFHGQKRINLNSGWRDPAFLRELMAYDLHRLAGAYYSRVQVVRFHVNGAFHGTFLEVEQPNEEYLVRLGLPEAVLYKADSPSNVSDERRFVRPADYVAHYEKESFSSEPHDDLHEFCSKLGTAARGAANLANLTMTLNVEAFANYLLANQYTSNWDAFNKNHYIALDRAGSGKWEMLPWDLDRTLGDHWDGRFDASNLHIQLGEEEHAGVTGWNRLFDRFYEQPELQQLYYDRVREFLLSELNVAAYSTWIDGLVETFGKDIDADRARWNGDATGMQWRNAVKVVKQYLARRRDFMLQSLPGDPPGKPSLITPAEGALADSLRVRLESSPYIPPVSGASHLSTLWQLRLDRAAWTVPAVDIETREDMTSIELPVLPGKAYVARLAHRGSNGKLSAFSDDRHFSTDAAGLEVVSIDLTPIFNADLIANAGDPENQPFEGTATFLVEEGYDGTATPNPDAAGLPLTRQVHGYFLGDYSARNSLQLKRGDAGTVEVAVPPGRYAALRGLVSGSGESQVYAELYYADGSTSRAVIRADDWEDDEVDDGPGARLRPEVTTVLNGLDAIVDGVFSDSNEFALFESVFAADPSQVLEKVVLFPEIGTGGQDGTRFPAASSRFNLFAIEGLLAGRPPGEVFRRGDTDGSGRMNVSDAISVLRHLFQGAGDLVCPDAADADDSGRLDIADAFVVLAYLFNEGAALPPPGPAACGTDVTPDGLTECRRSGCGE